MKSFVVAITVVLLGFVTVCKTDLDLYLDAHETYRLLGKSLFWENSVGAIRQNSVKDVYCLKFFY